MRYTLKMLIAFLAGMVMVVQSAELAADGKWVSVCLLGVLVFGLFVFIAYTSVVAEREASKPDNSVTISAGRAIIGGKLYEIPIQTVTPMEAEETMKGTPR